MDEKGKKKNHISAFNMIILMHV